MTFGAHFFFAEATAWRLLRFIKVLFLCTVGRTYTSACRLKFQVIENAAQYYCAQTATMKAKHYICDSIK